MESLEADGTGENVSMNTSLSNEDSDDEEKQYLSQDTVETEIVNEIGEITVEQKTIVDYLIKVFINDIKIQLDELYKQYEMELTRKSRELNIESNDKIYELDLKLNGIIKDLRSTNIDIFGIKEDFDSYKSHQQLGDEDFRKDIDKGSKKNNMITKKITDLTDTVQDLVMIPADIIGIKKDINDIKIFANEMNRRKNDQTENLEDKIKTILIESENLKNRLNNTTDLVNRFKIELEEQIIQIRSEIQFDISENTPSLETAIGKIDTETSLTLQTIDHSSELVPVDVENDIRILKDVLSTLLRSKIEITQPEKHLSIKFKGDIDRFKKQTKEYINRFEKQINAVELRIKNILLMNIIQILMIVSISLYFNFIYSSINNNNTDDGKSDLNINTQTLFF